MLVLRFYGRECGLLKFKIYAGVQGTSPPPQVEIIFRISEPALFHR